MCRLFCLAQWFMSNSMPALSVDPTLEVVIDGIAQRLDMRVVVIEAGNIGEMLAPRLFKAFLDLFVDFFQRLDAVR